MSSIFPQVEPILVPDAEVPYRGKLVWLSIAPYVLGNTLDATATIRTKPYRILTNGTVEQAPDSMDVNLHFPSVSAAAGSDPHLGKAIVAIARAVQEFINPPAE